MSRAALRPIRIGFVLHVMQVAGAEMLVAETIRRLSPRIAPVVLCLDGVGPLGVRLQAEGVAVIALNRKPGFDFQVARRLARAIAEYELEIVHAHQYTPFFYSALARLLLRRRIHLMFTEHGRHFPDRVSWQRRLVNRTLLVRLANEINAVCQFSADSLVQVDGFASRPIEVIPNGVDLPPGPADTRDELKRQLGLRPERRYVICIARFHPVKDHAMLVRAFAQVVADTADVDLVLAGDGPLRRELVRQAASLGMLHRILFLGVRDDVPELLRASDVFVLPSISEAASLTLLEAMAAARPVVVTAVGGNPEIVEHGEHGYLVPRGDDVATANALLKLLAEPVRARAMGEAGRERVRQRYQLTATIDTYYRRYLAAAFRLRARNREAPAVTA